MADLKYLNKYYLKTSFEMVGPIYIYKTYYYPYTKHNGLNCLNFVRPSCKLNRIYWKHTLTQEIYLPACL